ncbi:hypothetical protein C0J52_08155 [Blattella germanica]|nr:hypothetical protein C0J52_08155 [Blattella germanica]
MVSSAKYNRSKGLDSQKIEQVLDEIFADKDCGETDIMMNEQSDDDDDDDDVATENNTDEEWEGEENTRDTLMTSVPSHIRGSSYKGVDGGICYGGAGGEEDDDDEGDDDDEDDPDALQDPVYHLNLQQYLTEFLQSFSQQPYFHAFTDHLNDQEKQMLASIGVTT